MVATFSDYSDAVTRGLQLWAPGANLQVLKELGGGRSGAVVALVDVSLPKRRTKIAGNFTSGQYILKINVENQWSGSEPSESDRHANSYRQSPEFCKQHVPNLVRTHTEDTVHILLYDIAGFTLANIVTADTLSAGESEARLGAVASSILSEFNRSYSTAPAVPPSSVLREWLGYRLDPTQARELHELINHETNSQAVFYRSGTPLVNPLWLCSSPFLDKSRRTIFTGQIHGDLHMGNILCDRRRASPGIFWLIDFALSRSAPLLYDQAYLELAIMLNPMRSAGCERLLSVMAALDAPEGTVEARMVQPGDVGLLDCVRMIRSTQTRWQESEEPRRGDDFGAQELLARVAAGLNWANKPIGADRTLAFLYGAWAATTYVHQFHNEEFKSLLASADTRISEYEAHKSSSGGATEAPDELSRMWKDLRGFNESTKYVLIAGPQPPGTYDSSVGMLPWSAVVDMDHESDSTGLYAVANDVLRKSRAVQAYGLTELAAEFDRGTAWLMAAGWASHFEDAPESVRAWRNRYLPNIRRLCLELRRATSPQPIRVVVLMPTDQDERIVRIVECMDEVFADSASYHVLGSPSDKIDCHDIAYYNVTPSAFVDRMRSLFGDDESPDRFLMPGIDGPVEIAAKDARVFEEDIELVHFRVQFGRVPNQDAFWRGNLPTWADLHSEVDVRRDIHSNLVRELTALLGESRNLTLELHHAPGAGGTTAALRAAWELRFANPTAVLHRYSRLTGERISQLFQAAQLPVLLVADASVLPVPAREELYRDLAGRNCRAVILHVIRSAQPDPKRRFVIREPMSPSECEDFFKVYSALTDDREKLAKLRDLRLNRDPNLSRFRLPFFFGLVTYESEFTTLQRFVRTHLDNSNYRATKVLRYIAIVTKFTQIGIDVGFVRQLLDVADDLPLDDADALGNASKLLVYADRECKFMHPVIADEALNALLGGNEWDKNLKTLAIEFINDFVRMVGPDAEATRRLFIHLFIRRDEWPGDRRRRSSFSELITAIPSMAGQHQVLSELTEACPNEAHFWNHLGRHHIYKTKQDFGIAEKHLKKAVELSPEDPYHHHSLGMVRRFWIEDKVKDLFRRDANVPPDVVLDGVADLAEQAGEEFAAARELNPEDSHGYVTNIQVILTVADALVRASGGGTINAKKLEAGDVGQWLRANLVLAEVLLAQVTHMRGQAKPSDYEVKCASRLTRLYGNYDHVIAAWEGMLDRSAGQTELRRAIAIAYHARRQRQWTMLSQTDLSPK